VNYKIEAIKKKRDRAWKKYKKFGYEELRLKSISLTKCLKKPFLKNKSVFSDPKWSPKAKRVSGGLLERSSMGAVSRRT